MQCCHGGAENTKKHLVLFHRRACSTHKHLQTYSFAQTSFLSKAYLPTHVSLWVWGEAGGERDTFTWKKETHGLVDIAVQIDV